MVTIKLKYETDSDSKVLIQKYQDQYAICLRSVYNLLFDLNKNDLLESKFNYLKADSVCIKKIKSLNNIDLMNSWFINSAIQEAYQMVKAEHEHRVVFGGKALFKKISQHKISKENFLKERHNYPLYSIGTHNPYKGNRFFNIESSDNISITGIIFKPCRGTKIHLNVELQNYEETLLKLYLLQEQKTQPITYKIDQEYVYISYEETSLIDIKHPFIKNRVLAMDLNPNYIGWSIVDWSPDGQAYELVNYGIYSNKELNDKWFKLKKKNKKNKKKKKKQKGFASDSKERLHICNLRKHMVIEIAKNLINTAIAYKCQIISIEDLDMESGDKCRGKKFNSLCNNLWDRGLFNNNLQKRCNQHNLILQKVKANYSSFIGNMLYRDEQLPDMVLSSIEIGRRGFEYYNQYITKEKEQIKGSVMYPAGYALMQVQSVTKEVFGLESDKEGWVSLYKCLKKSKLMYRLSVEDFQIQFSNFLNRNTFIKYCDKNTEILYNKII